MTGWQRDELVEARADAILAGVETAEAYAEHFEAQMGRGTMRSLLVLLRMFRRPGVILLAVLLAPLGLLGYAAVTVRMAPVALSGAGQLAPVALSGAGQLAAVDTGSGQVVAVTPLPGPPGAVTAAGGSVWAADPAAGRLWRIDPATAGVVQTITLPWTRPAALAAGAGRVWVADPAARQLAEINPATGAVQRTLSLDLRPTAISIAGPAIWVAGSGTVEQLAAATGQVLARVRVPGTAALAAAAGSLWVVSSRAGTITRIDLATGAVTGTIPAGPGPAALAVGPGSVWVANSDTATITRIDPRTGQVIVRLPVTGNPTSLTVAGNRIWTALQPTAPTIGAEPDLRLPGKQAGRAPEHWPGLTAN